MPLTTDVSDQSMVAIPWASALAAELFDEAAPTRFASRLASIGSTTQ